MASNQNKLVLLGIHLSKYFHIVTSIDRQNVSSSLLNSFLSSIADIKGLFSSPLHSPFDSLISWISFCQ